jgi:periplasmic glucans biosynthesis protein
MGRAALATTRKSDGAEVSSFADVNTRGFGLMQRQRDFAAYQDLEARYERRPSLWVETIGGFGESEGRLEQVSRSLLIEPHHASGALPSGR